jgi:anti-anti-sigma factor
MAIQDWSDQIVVAELADDPQFTDEISSLIENLQQSPRDVVLNLTSVGFINSSNISRLLRLRKIMVAGGKHLILSGASTQVWGVLLVTGLDKIFEFTNDISTALAMLQLGIPAPAPAREAKKKK